jgi:integrase
VIDESRRHGIPGLGRHNQGISSNRGRKIHDTLHILFGWLQDQHRVVANAVAGLKRPRPPSSRSRVLNTDPNTRGADELRFFWGACSEIGQPWEVLFKLLLLTGARRDEIGQLKWVELNDDRTAILLEGSRTKNSRPLHLDLPPLATGLIKSIEPVSEKFVFSIAGHSAIAGYAKAKRRLDAAMLRLAKAEHGPDAEIAAWRLHDLRRSAATSMADIGILPHVIEACLNHVSGAKASVAGIYNRATYDNEKRAALVLWAEHVERIVTGTGGGKVLPLAPRKHRA